MVNVKSEALDAIGNLWHNLTELSVSDPDRYRATLEESAKEYAKCQQPPLPHACLAVKGGRRRGESRSEYVAYHVNVLSWDAVAQGVEGNPSALPLAGGKLLGDNDLFLSVAANGAVCKNALGKGATDTEQKSFVGVLFEFLEHQNDFLAFDRENWSLADDGKTKYVGDLARIQKSFSAAAAPPRQKNTATSFLVTRSTGELLSKIRADSGGGDAAGGKEVEEDDKKQILPLLNASNNSGNKRLVEEWNPGAEAKKKRNKTEFARNLERSLNKSGEKRAEDVVSSGDVMLRESSSFAQMAPVKSVRLTRKAALVGRSAETELEVGFKFYVPGLERMEDVNLQLSAEENVISAQSVDGYSARAMISAKRKVTKNCHIFSVHMTKLNSVAAAVVDVQLRWQ